MVSLSDIERAADAIRPAVTVTPFLRSVTLSQLTGAQIYLKFENLHFTASFKERGALNKLLSLDQRQKAAGVIAMSAGNHAQAVAYHAGRLGIAATIVMPRDTPLVKVRNTEALGASVILYGDALDEATDHASKLAIEQGLTFVHPFDDPAVIAGQGTAGLEMLQSEPGLDVILVPVGGGGLIGGIASAAKALKPEIQMIGVEAARYPCVTAALRGEEAVAGGATIAEGIAVKRPGKLTLDIIRDKVDDMLIVTEAQIERAISLLITIEKTVVEGAGAVGLAAVIAEPDRFRDQKVGLVLSGGNIDTRLLAAVLMRDLVNQGQIAQLRLTIPDRPGALAEVAAIIGEAGGNILEVQHNRLFSETQVKEADLELALEGRDHQHIHRIVDALTARGFAVRLLDPFDDCH
ncbi:MAG: threonine ammonia-lyase [Alphaproteobacteria bacterium]